MLNPSIVVNTPKNIMTKYNGVAYELPSLILLAYKPIITIIELISIDTGINIDKINNIELIGSAEICTVDSLFILSDMNKPITLNILEIMPAKEMTTTLPITIS